MDSPNKDIIKGQAMPSTKITTYDLDNYTVRTNSHKQ